VAFIADASKLRHGSIVEIQNPLSSSGASTHRHFFVVVRLPKNLKVGDKIFLVGISSSVSPENIDPALHVAMKWLGRPGGDPQTSLSKPCFACVNFTHLLEVYAGDDFPLEVRAEFRGKAIRSDKHQTIAALLDAWLPKP